MKVLQIKAAVRERDGQVCTECGMSADEHRQRFGKGLEVHRLIPGEPYSVPSSITLCKFCHGRKPKSPSRRKPMRYAVGFQINCEREWLDWVQAAADSLGMSAASYIRQATTQRLLQDGFPRPQPKPPKPKRPRD